MESINNKESQVSPKAPAVVSPTVFLDPTADEEDVPEDVPIMEIVKMLVNEVKKSGSYTSLTHLCAIKQYIELYHKYKAATRVKNPSTRASIAVARAVSKGPYFARKIRSLYCYIKRFHTLPPITAGKHHAHPTLLNNERMAQAVRHYLTVLADGEITPYLLMKQVNTVIIPALGLDLGGKTISESSARRWLVKLEYELKETKKGLYGDGHKREDVLAYRQKYLDSLQETERLRWTYTDQDLEPVEPTLAKGERRIVPIFHDEMIVYTNDLCHRIWIKDGKMPLRKKGQGRAIHVSDFIVEHTGHLALDETQIHENAALPLNQRLAHTDAREIMYPGKNHDGWLYPRAVLQFNFDQSSAHGAFAKDALNAKEMNVNPRGKQRHMHDTIIPLDNPHPHFCGQRQSMVFPADLPLEHPDYQYHGQPKGMLRILEERGLVPMLKAANGEKLVGECQVCKLLREAQERLLHEAQAAADGTQEPDEMQEDTVAYSSASIGCYFLDEKPLLQTVIGEAGHQCLFLPKFHCFRAAADETFPTAKRLVPQILDACSVKTIRAFFRKAWHYMDAYRKGLNAKQAEFAVKKYRSHRRCGSSLMMQVGLLVN
ncbi:uncharacterized protein LAESUDRAFT_738373 [Laetiporus sulphureus 93-53]|uniref:Uncharacterized protein n=1 Tax=Laetiporus sulphureus 93-53 TaxID=1314785 RepID=A0A165CNY4_9APHY|nr:uncharacterized protein LAESUDRAFT_738373 [Laetiporus sulphureus 93-53]KZT03152.1 hypothetical protein LAESUDRAFT_738373 [Laetiporus sulphureus 93-53]